MLSNHVRNHQAKKNRHNHLKIFLDLQQGGSLWNCEIAFLTMFASLCFLSGVCVWQPDVKSCELEVITLRALSPIASSTLPVVRGYALPCRSVLCFFVFTNFILFPVCSPIHLSIIASMSRTTANRMILAFGFICFMPLI